VKSESGIHLAYGNEAINGKGKKDERNNVEQIEIEITNHQIVVIEIHGHSIHIGKQSYALVVTMDGESMEGRATQKPTSCQYPTRADGEHRYHLDFTFGV
jgi:hypothetical protein